MVSQSTGLDLAAGRPTEMYSAAYVTLTVIIFLSKSGLE